MANLSLSRLDLGSPAIAAVHGIGDNYAQSSSQIFVKTTLDNANRNIDAAKNYSAGCKLVKDANLMEILTVTGTVALFAIGCVAAGGAFPVPYLSATTIAVAGGTLLCAYASGNMKEKKVALIFATAIMALVITFAGLGLMKILSAPHVGFGIAGTVLAAVPLLYKIFVDAREKKRQELFEEQPNQAHLNAREEGIEGHADPVTPPRGAARSPLLHAAEPAEPMANSGILVPGAK